jgi:hypothetical protein
LQDKELTVRQRYWLEHVNDRPDDLRDQISNLFNSLLMALNGLKLEYPLGSV